jgi:acyl-CoA reductase-like NAD-dependent aldehyde dehydrogenase
MDVARACYEDDWRRRSVAQRAGIVHAAAPDATAKRSPRRPGDAGNGKAHRRGRGEVALLLDILDYYAERAEAFLKPQLTPDAHAPWRFLPPFSPPARPLAGASPTAEPLHVADA